MPNTIDFPSPGKVTIIAGKDQFIRPMNLTIEGKKYSFLGAGSFNIAYKSTTAPYEVYKEPLSTTELTDLPDRAVRLWNDINPTMPARVAGNGKGWIAPFISGTPASDQEISDALIDIYMRTGRVVVDAFVKSNFIKMGNGTIACIDIGSALQLETRLEEEKSHTSLGFWDTKGMKKVYDSVLLSSEIAMRSPFIANTIQALLYCTLYALDGQNLEFLKTHRDVMISLANAYEKNTGPEDAIPEILKKQVGPADKLPTTTSAPSQLNAASFDPNHPEYRIASQYCTTPDDFKKLSDAFAALQTTKSNDQKLSSSPSNDDEHIHARLVVLKRKIEFEKTIYEIRERNGKNYTGLGFFRRAGQSAGEKCIAANAMLQELDGIEKFLESYGQTTLQPLTLQTEQVKKAMQQGKLGELYKELQTIKKELEPDAQNFRNFNLH